MENRTRINPHGSRLPSPLPPSVSPQPPSPRARQAVSRRTSEAFSQPDIVCFSHLRWDFVFQRPQHLLTRAARHFRVVFIEEPVTSDRDAPSLEIKVRGGGISVAVPNLPCGISTKDATMAQRLMLDELLNRRAAAPLVFW